MKGLRDDRSAGTAAGRALLPLCPAAGCSGAGPHLPLPSLSLLHKLIPAPSLPALSPTHLPRALRAQTESSREQELSLHF